MKHLVMTLCLLLALGTSASATHFYTVVLTNGTSFETREVPVEADWDSSIMMMRTDQGNWIALPADEIADVVSREEQSGFGYRVDVATVVIGQTPNDLVDDGPLDEDGDPNDDGEGGGGSATGQGTPRYEAPDLEPEPTYRLEQFVTIPADGHLGGDVPAEPPGI